MCWLARYDLGNIYKSSLKDLWENSARIKDLRKVTEESFPKCLECEAYDFVLVVLYVITTKVMVICSIYHKHFVMKPSY